MNHTVKLKNGEEIEYESPLGSQQGCLALISILIDRLGGEVKIEQKDFDDVSYRILNETIDEEAPEVTRFWLGKDKHEPR